MLQSALERVLRSEVRYRGIFISAVPLRSCLRLIQRQYGCHFSREPVFVATLFVSTGENPKIAPTEPVQATIDDEVIQYFDQIAKSLVPAAALYAFSSPAKPFMSSISRSYHLISGKKPVLVGTNAYLAPEASTSVPSSFICLSPK